MGTKEGTLLFRKRLLAPAMLALREKLAALADRSLEHGIYVDTLLGMHFDRELQLPDCQSFLIFDFYRIFIYENSKLADGPKINSAIRCLCDDSPVRPIKIFASYAQQQFQFLYPLEILEVLPLLWADRQPGIIITLDLSTPEIRKARIFVHPECERPHIKQSAADCLIAMNGPHLRDRFTGPALRVPSTLS